MFSSEMQFGSLGWRSVSSGEWAKLEGEDARAIRLVRREFQLKGVALTCRQYQSLGARTDPELWQIHCETPVGVRGQYFSAWFHGTDTDIPAFYRVIEGVVPAM